MMWRIRMRMTCSRPNQEVMSRTFIAKWSSRAANLTDHLIEKVRIRGMRTFLTDGKGIQRRSLAAMLRPYQV